MPREKGFGDGQEYNSSKRTYYNILGVSQNADSETIRSAFRTKAKKTHPDKPENRGKEEQFKEVNEAYQVLSDPEMRRRYDLSFQTGPSTPPRQETPRQQPPQREKPQQNLKTKFKKDRPQSNHPTTDFGFGFETGGFNDYLRQSREDFDRMMKESRASTERMMNDLREQRRKEQEIVVSERNGLFIGKQGGFLIKEYLLDPATKQPISKGYDQIVVRDGLVIGSHGFIHPEYLLNRKTGQVIGGYRGYV